MAVSSSRSQLLPNVAGFVGAIPFFIGISGLLKPSDLLASAGFPTPTTLEAQKLADAITRLYAVRNTVIGLLSSAIWYKGDRKLLGWAMIIMSISPVVDALISLDLIGGGMWNHLPIVPITVGLGAGLLGWLG